MTSGSCEVDRERASERTTDRRDRTAPRFGFVRRRTLLRIVTFCTGNSMQRIPAIVATLNSAFRSCQSLSFLSFSFARARKQPGNIALHNRKGTVPIQGQTELLSRAFIRFSGINFLYYVGRFYPRSAFRTAGWISTRQIYRNPVPGVRVRVRVCVSNAM